MAKILGNWTVFGNFSCVMAQNLINIDQNSVLGQVLAESGQNFGEFDIDFAELGRNTAKYGQTLYLIHATNVHL